MIRALLVCALLGVGLARADDLADLRAGPWRVTRMGDTVLSAPSPPTLRIEGVGEAIAVFGRAPCNAYCGTGTVRADGSIAFGDLVTTLIGCPGAVALLERRFLDAMIAVRRFEFARESGQLILRDAAGNPALVLVRETP